jgi:hypothetical protein
MLRAEYDLFDKGLARSGNQFARFNESTYVAQQKLKRFASVGLQQAGYQVNDFIVQISSGQNALVAFGQQGSQLAGIFGTKGAVAGALIAGVAALANLAYQAWKAKNDIKELKDVMDEFKTAAGSYKSSVDLLNEALEIPGLSKGKDQLVSFLQLLKNNELYKFSESIKATMEAVLLELDLQGRLDKLAPLTVNPYSGAAIVESADEKAAREKQIDDILKINSAYAALQNAAPDEFVQKLMQMTLYMRNAGVLSQGTLNTFKQLATESGLLAEYTEALAEAENKKAKAAKSRRTQNTQETKDFIAERQVLIEQELEFQRIGLEGQAKLDAKVKQMANDAAKNYLAKRAAQKQILDDLMIENSLAAEANASGADSLEYLQLKNRFDRESLVARLDEIKVFGPLRDNIIAAADEGYEAS